MSSKTAVTDLSAQGHAHALIDFLSLIDPANLRDFCRWELREIDKHLNSPEADTQP